MVHGPEDGLVAPHDLDCEGTLLSHCLINGPVAGIEPKHFYSDANARVYQAIKAAGMPTDIVEVKRWLRLMLHDAAHYLGVLLAQPVTIRPELHAETIRELYRRRTLSDAALRLRVELRAGELESSAAWQRFKQICEEINNVPSE